MNKDIQYERSNNYRKQFFASNKPFFKKYYICSYCGRLLTINQVTVDHLIPIKKVKSKKGFFKKVETMIYRKLLKFLKIDNVNDHKNLVVACNRCNSKKGART